MKQLMNELVGGVTIDYQYYSGKDLYVDGAEERLLSIVKQHTHDEYNEIISQNKDWGLLYHLSDIRGNIIEWIPFSSDDDVLEIGAGCGAITGTLAKNAGHVDCIELSKVRSLVNAYRNKQYNNINILVGNFQEIENKLTKQYDYITLIGVLEYAAMYIDSKSPYIEMLQIAKSHLKPGGKIIVAIENKNGLKYWAGCKEDHLATYFSGIEGYPYINDIKTFSKKGLTDLVHSAGFEQVKFYYPYPDYKLPTAIYSDEYLPEEAELRSNIVNFDNDRMLLFDEDKVFDELIKDGLFTEFSNSFLVIMNERGEK